MFFRGGPYRVLNMYIFEQFAMDVVGEMALMQPNTVNAKAGGGRACDFERSKAAW
jgi:hypothetical protein